MHPAASVIFFTVSSGAGFGLLAFLGLGLPPATGWTAFVFYLIGYVLAVGGLMASALHLGNPQRALKAFTQWRTSWLSREAWLAVIALSVTGLYAIGTIFLGTRIAPLGWLCAVLSMITVFATSMIYAQLRTIPRWNQWLTPLYYLAFSISGGAMLAGQVQIAIWSLPVAALIQIAHWFQGDRQMARRGHTIGTATGLGGLGRLRQFEPPHTGGNYLTREMVHVIGRKHAVKLRVISLLLMAILPVMLLAVMQVSHLLALLAIVSHLAGALVSRWLFFAEAEHVVGLYYGQHITG